MEPTPPPQQPNTLGRASLLLGVASVSLVFGIGLCALVGQQQGWLPIAGTVLYVCGASSAFLGFLGLVLGVGGLLGRSQRRAAAIAGLVLGLAGVCLFIAVLTHEQACRITRYDKHKCEHNGCRAEKNRYDHKKTSNDVCSHEL